LIVCKNAGYRGSLYNPFKLIINKILVEAAGVELFNPLILRRLLVLQGARNAKNAPLPRRRYKNGTKTLCFAGTQLAGLDNASRRKQHTL
jgi:hypothetical protein